MAGSRAELASRQPRSSVSPGRTKVGRVLARPAPGVVRSCVRKAPTTRFVHKILEFSRKCLKDHSRHFLQTTPVPLRDRCRCAALPLQISGGGAENSIELSATHWLLSDFRDRIKSPLGKKGI